MTERRVDLTGIDKAVAETLDEVNARMHGLVSGGSYHREFLDWLAERGYQVVLAEPTGDTAGDDGCGVSLWMQGADGRTVDLGTCPLPNPHSGDCEPRGGWPSAERADDTARETDRG